ncbi:hypothetical protein MC885_016544 [Smutsia gigantea]|nr:hypothetical protein MC885_016544 [Smutsia gigantea]
MVGSGWCFLICVTECPTGAGLLGTDNPGLAPRKMRARIRQTADGWPKDRLTVGPRGNSGLRGQSLPGSPTAAPLSARRLDPDSPRGVSERGRPAGCARAVAASTRRAPPTPGGRCPGTMRRRLL